MAMQSIFTKLVNQCNRLDTTINVLSYEQGKASHYRRVFARGRETVSSATSGDFGVFVREIVTAPATSFAADVPMDFVYWDAAALNRDVAVKFRRCLRPTDIVAVISAKSETALAARMGSMGTTMRLVFRGLGSVLWSLEE
jgi:hypothetical protein